MNTLNARGQTSLHLISLWTSLARLESKKVCTNFRPTGHTESPVWRMFSNIPDAPGLEAARDWTVE